MRQRMKDLLKYSQEHDIRKHRPTELSKMSEAICYFVRDVWERGSNRTRAVRSYVSNLEDYGIVVDPSFFDGITSPRDGYAKAGSLIAAAFDLTQYRIDANVDFSAGPMGGEVEDPHNQHTLPTIPLDAFTPQPEPNWHIPQEVAPATERLETPDEARLRRAVEIAEATQAFRDEVVRAEEPEAGPWIAPFRDTVLEPAIVRPGMHFNARLAAATRDPRQRTAAEEREGAEAMIRMTRAAGVNTELAPVATNAADHRQQI